MARKTSVATRQSARLAHTNDAGVSGVKQSRITEFVSARKRSLEPKLAAKKMAGERMIAAEPTNTTGTTGTPVKIRKRSVADLEARIEAEAVATAAMTAGPTSNVDEKAETTGLGFDIHDEMDSVAGVCEETSRLVSTVSDTQLAPSVKEPAFKKYMHLVQPQTCKTNAIPALSGTDSPIEPLAVSRVTATFVPWLPLSDRFTIYERLMFSLDSMCVLMAGRSQPCIFHKVHRSLEGVLGRKISLEHLERIKTLWPEAYEHRATSVIQQGRRVESVAISIPALSAGAVSSAALLSARREEMKTRVQQHVIKIHAVFAATRLGRAIPEDAVLRAWHPDFDQETIADIVPSLLFPPSATVEAKATPREISRLLPARESVARESTAPAVPVTEQQLMHAESQTAEARGLSLLERIRAKEQKMQAGRLLGDADPERTRELAILSQMERFTQSLSFIFASSRKTTLFLADLTATLMQSSSIPLSAAEVLARLQLLKKCVPGWIEVSESAGESARAMPRTVRLLNRQLPLRDVLASIQAYTRRLQH